MFDSFFGFLRYCFFTLSRRCSYAIFKDLNGYQLASISRSKNELLVEKQIKLFFLYGLRVVLEKFKNVFFLVFIKIKRGCKLIKGFLFLVFSFYVS